MTRLGADNPGFLHWVGAESRFAITYVFDRDTGGDGKIEAKVGDHGELLGDTPSVHLLDFELGKEEVILKALDASADGQYLAFLDLQQRLILLNAGGKRSVLTDADIRDDINPCLPARQARFDPSSTVLVYPTSQGAKSRNLKSGQTYTITQSDLWRAEATPVPTWFQMAIGEAPKVSGSCPCSWCSRFATSVGTYALEGTFEKVLKSTQGKSASPGLIPLTDSWLADPKTKRLSHIGEDSVPASCKVIAIFPGEPKALIRCGIGVDLWDLNTKVRIALDPIPKTESWVVEVKRREGLAFANVSTAEAGKTRQAALHLESGRIEVAPESRRVGPPHSGGWQLLETPTGLVLWDPLSGALMSGEIKVSDLGPLSFKTPEGWFVVSPLSGKYIPVDAKPKQVSRAGCVVLPNKKAGKFDRGPWTRICP